VDAAVIGNVVYLVFNDSLYFALNADEKEQKNPTFFCEYAVRHENCIAL
jgi:hypothetical protein